MFNINILILVSACIKYSAEDKCAFFRHPPLPFNSRCRFHPRCHPSCHEAVGNRGCCHGEIVSYKQTWRPYQRKDRPTRGRLPLWSGKASPRCYHLYEIKTFIISFRCFFPVLNKKRYVWYLNIYIFLDDFISRQIHWKVIQSLNYHCIALYHSLLYYMLFQVIFC